MSTSSVLKRRAFLRFAGVTTAGAVLASCAPAATSLPLTEGPVTTADQALQQLKEGNQRFVAGTLLRPNQSNDRRAQVAKGQKPWAIILGCIDSRVPPEMVFDRGLGDLFVIRTAAQVIDNAVLGSIEFGAEEFGVPLIVVLGHQKCGGVTATNWFDSDWRSGWRFSDSAPCPASRKPSEHRRSSSSGTVHQNISDDFRR